jgi:hypothetical protein
VPVLAFAIYNRSPRCIKECYVHGMMNGDTSKDGNDEKVQKFVVV